MNKPLLGKKIKHLNMNILKIPIWKCYLYIMYFDKYSSTYFEYEITKKLPKHKDHILTIYKCSLCDIVYHLLKYKCNV